MTCLADKTILAIDDTAAIRTFLKISLMDQGVTFYEAGNASQGLAMCKEHQPDVVILDLGLPDRDGLDLLPDLKTVTDKKPPAVVVLTVRNDRKTRDLAAKLGAEAYMTKPFEVDDLVETIEKSLD